MEFKKYQHVERFGRGSVLNIELGTCYVFPKIDGTNSSIWLGEDGIVRGGSRNRELSLEKDNAGFYESMLNNANIKAYLEKHPTHRLYGEWLVPHSLKTYRDDAWRRFYIFDICLDREDGSVEYIPYDIYKVWLEEFNLDYIVPLKVINNGSYENFVNELDNNNFMIKDGMGTGEGIVIKNYDFYNGHGQQIWAKIVTSEFKERHHKQMGCPIVENKMVEQSIVDEFVTIAFIEKEYAKILNDNDGVFNSKDIPKFLSKVSYELINEEMWNILKKYKNPTINFKTLNALTIKKIKNVKKDIFM